MNGYFSNPTSTPHAWSNNKLYNILDESNGLPSILGFPTPTKNTANKYINPKNRRQ